MREITFDNRPFIAACRRLMAELGISLDKAMCWQMALMCRTIVSTIGGIRVGADEKGASLSQQRKAGENAVIQDLNAMFTALQRDDEWFIPRGQRQVTATYQALRNKKGAVWLVDKDHFFSAISISEMEKFHKAARRKDGRVTFAERKTNIGRWKGTNKYHVPKEVLIEYKKQQVSHVGKTKACWLKGLDYFTARSGGLARWMPPQWVQRHSRWAAPYSYSGEDWSPREFKGEWWASSNIAFGRNPQSAVDHAVRLRHKDLSGAWFYKKVQGIIDKYNAKGVVA